MLGRDIGTVVLPKADLKLYVTASPEERARRRYEELKDRYHGLSYEQILVDMRRRDAWDSERAHSPLRPAADALILDTTYTSPEELVEHILSHDLLHRD
jgi:cytidylate kinase